MRKVSRRALPCLFIAAALGGARAEGTLDSAFPRLSSALPAEAPSSIFDAKLGDGPDSDAQLLVSGSWSATVLSSLDFQSTSGSALSLSTSQPILFTQDPALALSFLLYKKIFVDAEVSSDIAKAKYSAGYRGGEGELVREFRLGNDSISFPSLPYLSFGSGSYRSFGASLLVGDDTFAGKAMLRYDQAERTEKRFIGSTEISDTTIAASGFISGKYFLTLAAPTTNLVIYVQSASGTLSGSDGKLYRKLSSDEYSYTASTGLVTLSKAATTRVAAYYSGSGSSGAGSDYYIKVGDLACDFLYDPPDSEHTSATIDPKLQVLCRYATTATASGAVAYVKNVSAAKEDALFEVAIDDSGYAEVARSGASALSSTSTPSERQAYRQPFADSNYGDMAWIYTKDFDCTTAAAYAYAPSYTRSVVVRGFSSASSITIDSNFVPGSVEVTRNGLPDYSFSVNEDTGVLTLLPAPSASEEIVVSYMKEDSQRKSGLLVGALGGFWDLGDGRSAWAALGSTWSVPGSSYSSGGSSSPGSVALSAGAKDTLGDFTASLALAGRYKRDDSTGLYRIEGMESSTSYATTFRYADYNTATGTSSTETHFSATESADSDLSDSFPSLVSSLHADGTTQKALKIVAGAAGYTAQYYKVEDAIEYDSYQTFSFYAKLPPDAALTVALDDGAASPTTSVGIVLPAGSGDGSWKRYILHYGKGDASVYVQTSQSGSESLLDTSGGSPTLPSVSSSGSRLVISVSGLAAGEVAWIDEVGLSDSVGEASLLAQARASYSSADWKLGPALSPILSDLAASAYAQGAYASSSYAAGGGSLKTTLSAWGFPLARLGFDASAKLTSGSGSFSGGHSITLPAKSFPIQVSDGFDYDPGSGAFGRSDSLSLAAERIASLSASQESAWTPSSSSLEAGMLLQTWKGSLSLGPSLVAVGLEAKNRAWPASAPRPADSGSNYGAAWLSAYAYALPACEDSSDLREAKLSLSLKTPGAKEFLSASLGESSSPQSATTGLRRDAASARLSAPLSLGGIAFEPYYSRSWKDKRSGRTDGILKDAEASLGDFSALPVLYGSVPFQEFFASSTLSDFGSQTEPSGTGLPLALYLPEAGFSLSREYGSAWYDFVLPAAMSFSYGRSLERESDSLTDDSIWSATAKLASINLFGSMGAYPIALGGGSLFDSDEYLSTIQSTYTVPRDGGASSLELLFHGLATLHMGAADTFDLESKATVSDSPTSLAWSSSLEGKLSNRIAHHWLLDLFERSLEGARPKPDASGKESSIASQYLVDLASREANFRRTIGLSGGLSGYRSDASSYLPGYAFAESYEAKITVPERLTLKLAAAFDQSLVASTQVFTLGFELSLNVVISF